jgi:hypothetical protein
MDTLTLGYTTSGWTVKLQSLAPVHTTHRAAAPSRTVVARRLARLRVRRRRAVRATTHQRVAVEDVQEWECVLRLRAAVARVETQLVVLAATAAVAAAACTHRPRTHVSAPSIASTTRLHARQRGESNGASRTVDVGLCAILHICGVLQQYRSVTRHDDNGHLQHISREREREREGGREGGRERGREAGRERARQATQDSEYHHTTPQRRGYHSARRHNTSSTRQDARVRRWDIATQRAHRSSTASRTCRPTCRPQAR